MYVVHEVAAGLVRSDPRVEAYRAVLEDGDRLQAYLDDRDRVFLAPRPIDLYVDALRSAGFTVDDVSDRTVEAAVEEWYEFLSAYADAMLDWVGEGRRRRRVRTGRRRPAGPDPVGARRHVRRAADVPLAAGPTSAPRETEGGPP